MFRLRGFSLYKTIKGTFISNEFLNVGTWESLACLTLTIIASYYFLELCMLDNFAYCFCCQQLFSQNYFFQNDDKNSEYDQEIPQSQTADKPMAPRGRATQPSQHQEDNLSKATSSLFMYRKKNSSFTTSAIISLC